MVNLHGRTKLKSLKTTFLTKGSHHFRCGWSSELKPRLEFRNGFSEMGKLKSPFERNVVYNYDVQVRDI